MLYTILKDKFGRSWLVLCVVLTFVVVSPTMNSGWVNRDDPQYVLKNAMIQGNLTDQFPSIFTEQVMGNFHPLTMLSLKINFLLSGNEAFGYHLTNILLHLMSTILVFIFVFGLTKNYRIAFIVALLFGIHPMHMESVAWISARKDVLYVPFMLLGMNCWLTYSRQHDYRLKLWALFWFILAVLSKPMAVVFPLILICIDIYEGRELDKKLIIEKLPFFLISTIAGIIAMYSQSVASAFGNASGSIPDRIITPFYGLTMYGIKSITPYQLSAFHPYPDQSLLTIPYILAIPFCVLLLYSIWYFRTDRTYLSGIGIFLISIFPVLQILSFGDAIIAERYTYFSYLGLFILYGSLLVRLFSHPNQWLRKGAFLFFILLISVFSIQSFQRCQVWQDSDALWSDVIAKYPNHFLAYGARGNYWSEKKQFEQSIEDYTKSLELNSFYPGTLTNRGQSYRALGKWDLALQDFNEVIRLDSSAYAYLNRGSLYGDLREFDAAERDLTHAIYMQPRNPELWSQMAELFKMQNDYTSVITHLDKAILLSQPNPILYFNRGHAYCMNKQYGEGILDFNKCIELDNENSKAYYNRSRAYYASGNLSEAKTDALKALELGFRIPENYRSALGL